jgi:predicted ferric reductase
MWTILSTTAKKSPISLRLLTGLVAIELLLLLWGLLPPILAPMTDDSALWASEKLAWYLTRSSGAVAYIVLSASTVWGLLLSTRVIKEWVPGAVALTMHETLSWLAVGLAAFHALVLLFDHYYTYTLSNLLIPFTGPYEPLWVGLGTLAFYLLLLLSATFYARRWIGAKRWRQLHYLTFGAYGLVTLHGWLAGTDSATFGWLYGASAFIIIFLTVYRVIATIGSAQTMPQPKRQRATD